MKIFDVGRAAVNHPNCGKFIGQMPLAEIYRLTTDLTERERSHPHAKYYDEPMGPIQVEHEAALKAAPLDPKDCYMPCEAGRHLNNSGYDKFENGYGVLENGVGFAAAKVDLDGITDEMIHYFSENFAHCDDLYYKTWFPGAHLINYIDGIIENFGWDMLNMHMSFTTDLCNLGFDEENILKNDPSCINIVIANGLSTPIYHPETGEEFLSMLCYTRDLGDRRELRVRYWVGLAFDDMGNVMIRKNRGEVSTLEKAKLMMEHCMREYCNQKHLIKKFWEANH